MAAILEIGTELAVYIKAQRRLFEHFQQPTPEQATWLEALLAEDAQQTPLSRRLCDRLRSQCWYKCSLRMTGKR